MPNEKQNYRINLESLKTQFPDKMTISVAEAARYVGCHPSRLMNQDDFPRRKLGRQYVVPLTNFASWLS